MSRISRVWEMMLADEGVRKDENEGSWKTVCGPKARARVVGGEILEIWNRTR